MTVLGIIFLTALAFGLLLGGRNGLLAVAASGIPFNDSAALLIGGIPIAPFYLGILLYLPLAYFSIGMPRLGASSPWLLGMWAFGITLVGPALFAGLPVVKSELRQEHVLGNFWTLFNLDYSRSNVAQVGYLVLNLLLLMAIACSAGTPSWIPTVPAFVGTTVAVIMWISREAGIDWPRLIFANSDRMFAHGVRFAGPFTEPSKLGVFALTSAVLLGALAIKIQSSIAKRAILSAFVAFDLFLVIESASLTALAGAGLLAAVMGLRSLYLVVSQGSRIPVVFFFLVPIVVAISPAIIGFTMEIVEYKLDSLTSLQDRRWADTASWRVFIDSYTLGVGLGSNRSSSLIFLIISQIGLVGTALFLMLMIRAIRDGLRDAQRFPFAASLIALLAASFFSLADFVSPMTWMLAGFCWDTNVDPRRPRRGFPFADRRPLQAGIAATDPIRSQNGSR